MKKLLILLVIAIISASCKNEAPIDYVIFSGQITNKTAHHIILVNDNERDTIPVSESGDFLDTLRIAPGSYLITHDKIFTRVYLEPSSNLNISFDTKDFKNSLNFSEDGAAINNYLQEKSLKERDIMGDFDEFYSLDEQAFKTRAKEIKLVKEEFLESQQGISKAYKTKEKRNIEYEYLSKLMGYERSKSYATKKPDFKVSENFLPRLTDFDYNNAEDFEFSSSYKRLVSDHLRTLSKALVNSENLDDDIAYIKAVSTSPNQEIKNELLFDDAKYGISYTSDLESYYDIFINASTDIKNNQTITESYKKLITVAKGKPSPRFFDYENNDGSKTSLDDLKGKYVYIDVWATWCGPCIKEIPSLKEVEKSYHGKNIQFLSVSIDKLSDHNKWKKMISDENLGGIQVLADNAWESKFVQDYLIMGIPRFILLDPQGNIVTANAPRPSEEKLIALFNDLNI